ncbi:MAG: hypothetical protein Q9195_001316 [Heterodermia aff. obscurata]
MPICIECRYPVSQLYHVLHSSNKSHKSPSHSNTAHQTAPIPSVTGRDVKKYISSKSAAGGGADVRLTQCPRCKRFADKYVEHDFVVLFIDLVLVKPQVYRHLLFNRLGRDDDELDLPKPSIIRLGTLLLLFDVYLTWIRIEAVPSHLISSSSIPYLHILVQYVFYLLLCTLTALAQHITVRWLAARFGLSITHHPQQSTSPELTSQNTSESVTATPRATANGISTALFVSSCMKLFPILMVVWKYDGAENEREEWNVGKSVGRGVEWAVALQNLEALRILLGCGYLSAAGLVAAGAIARWIAAAVVLGGFGLGAALGT